MWSDSLASRILLSGILSDREKKENVTGASLSTILPVAKLTEVRILIGIKITEFTEYTLSSTDS